MPEALKNILRVAALFILVLVAIVLYKVVLPAVPGAPQDWSATTTPVVALVAPDLLIINNLPFKLEVADTPAKQEQGLSGRASLATGTGMLFVFNSPGRYGFWMKQMSFPIDIIWFDPDFKPVYVVEKATPASFPQTFYPPKPAQYVLEVAAGEWQRALLSTE